MTRRLAMITVALLLALPSRSWAGIICPTDMLATYTTPGFSCTILDKTFSAFSYAGTASGTAVAIAASAVAVVPIELGGEIGFEFDAGWSVGPGNSQDSAIGYTVTAADPYSIVDAVLSMSGASFTNDGVAAVAENLSDTLTGTLVANLSVATDSSGTVLSQSATFAAVSSLKILQDISVLGGSTGTAAVSAVTNLFSQATPTPTDTPTPTPTSTATPTPTDTPTPTPTSTPTPTPTGTPTATSTPTPLALGEACSSGTQCASTFCAPSGVCCNAPCTEPNQSCTLPNSVGLCRAQGGVAPAASRSGVVALSVLLAVIGIASLHRTFRARRV